MEDPFVVLGDEYQVLALQLVVGFSVNQNYFDVKFSPDIKKCPVATYL